MMKPKIDKIQVRGIVATRRESWILSPSNTTAIYDFYGTGYYAVRVNADGAALTVRRYGDHRVWGRAGSLDHAAKVIKELPARTRRA